MAQPDRDPGRDAQTSGDAADASGGTGTDDNLRAGDSYEEILAFLTGYRPKPDDVLGETRIFQSQTSSMPFPTIAIDPKRVPLLLKELDAETVRLVQERLDGIEAGIFAETIRDSGGPLELLTNIRQAVAQAMAHRLFFAVCYGIGLDGRITTPARVGETVEARFPDGGGIRVCLDDHLNAAPIPWPKTEPYKQPNGETA